jgi:predicted nucleic acid-binding protein
MKGYRICIDTNIWIDFIERKSNEAEKSKQLLSLLTQVKSPHEIIIPVVLYIEIAYKLFDIKKENYLVASQKYSTLDLKSNDGKKLKFETKLPKNEEKNIQNIIKDLKTSDKTRIISTPIDFSNVESLIMQGFEPLDSMIIIQANKDADYFVTKDGNARKVNNIEERTNLLNIHAISLKGMLSLLERNDKKKTLP